MPRLSDTGPLWEKSWASLGEAEPLLPESPGHLLYLHDSSAKVGLINCKYSNFNFRRTPVENSEQATGVIAAFMVTEGEARLATAQRIYHCGPGEAVLLDFDQPFHFGNEILTTTTICILFLPRVGMLLPSASLRQGLKFSDASLSGGLLAAVLFHISGRFGAIEPGDLSPLAPSLTALVSAAAAEALPPDVKWGRELRMSRIIRFIDTNLASRQLGPDLIAGHFAMSRATLYRMFEPLGGVAAVIRERRLARAMADLTAAGSPSRSVAAAGRKAGYPDAASFSRAFRAHFGMPPAEAARLRTARPPQDNAGSRKPQSKSKTLGDYLRELGTRQG